MTSGSGDVDASAEGGMKRRDLLLFKWRPTVEPSSSTILSADRRASGGPISVPSSRYHAFRVREGTSVLMRTAIG